MDLAPNDGEQRFAAAPRKTSGRGLSYWKDGAGNQRLIVVTPGFYLVSLDPGTGRQTPGFGENGVVDLMVGVRGEVTDKTSIGNSSPALVIGDVIVVGPAHEVGMRPPAKTNLKGDVRGYDARTRQAALDVSHDPRGGGARLRNLAERLGRARGQRRCLGADLGRRGARPHLSARRSAVGRTYGGERPGSNLYGNSLVCLDAKTGEKVWHYQLIHHDIWDWDNPTAPILMDIVGRWKTREGRRADHETGLGLHVRPDQRYARLANRGAGSEGRRRAGEWYSPTQPFPTKPPAFDRQGVTEDDLIDFTPALRAEALEGMKGFRMGPIFTPPSLAMTADGTQGTIVLPSFTGGANWEGGSFDPETNVLYVGSYTQPSVAALQPEPNFSNMPLISGGGAALPFLDGLPVIKPPWGRITAIDMNKGEHLFQIPNGPTPKEITEHPKLKGLDIPPTGRATRPVVLARSRCCSRPRAGAARPRCARTTRRRARCSRTFRCLGRRWAADVVHDRRQTVRRRSDRGRARRADRRAVTPELTAGAICSRR